MNDEHIDTHTKTQHETEKSDQKQFARSSKLAERFDYAYKLVST